MTASSSIRGLKIQTLRTKVRMAKVLNPRRKGRSGTLYLSTGTLSMITAIILIVAIITRQRAIPA